MFVLCIAYWCVNLCCSSDLQLYVKIATPTALSASALRPRPYEAETGETIPVPIYPVSEYLRKDGVKRNRVDL